MEIRFFKKVEKSILKKAIDTLWATNHILSRDEKLLDFMFSNYPNSALIAEEDELNFLGAWENGEVIGLLGVMPFTFNNKGKKGIACCLTNWIVNPEYRHLGAGLALINYVHSLKPDMILSLGVSLEGSKVYKLMRWDIFEDVPRWIGLGDKNLAVKLLLKNDEKPVRYWNEIQRVNNNSTYTTLEVTTLDNDQWNAFYWNGFAMESVGIARDASFLNWRYFKHPDFNYRVVVCKEDNQYKGIAIVRFETILENQTIGRIVEFIACDQDSAVQLANAIISLEEYVLFYDYYCFSNISSWGLETIGFKRIFKSENDQYVLPSRFQPMDYQNTSMLSAVYLSDKLKDKWNPLTDQVWYITKGDSDQDRPN